MAEDYDVVIARQPGGRLSKRDIQRARHGSKLDERRHEQRQTIVRVIKFVAALGSAGAVVAETLKLLNVHF